MAGLSLARKNVNKNFISVIHPIYLGFAHLLIHSIYLFNCFRVLLTDWNYFFVILSFAKEALKRKT